MGRDPRYDILFEPIQIGPHVLKNRFYQVPHCSGFGTRKPGSQARHRGVKAEGGWAAVNTEFAAITPDTDETPYTAATAWDADDVLNLSLMCDEAHQHGALAGIQLHHGGAHADRRESRWPAIAPSQIASDLGSFVIPEVPKEMDLDDINRIQESWVAAAERGRDAGFDIIYVYGGHGYLLAQFLSPYYNKRTDSYGGPLENRARLWLETLERVRRAVGDRCVIAVRIAIDALDASRIPLDDTLNFIRLADDLVDLWDVNLGSIVEWQRDSGASRFYQEGYQLEYTRHARNATKKPIVGVGRLTNPDTMVEILRGGAQDLIGGARPSIADPFLPRKIQEGRLDEIRECIGINTCTGRAVQGDHLGCAQNATAGEEYRRGWHPERYEPSALTGKDVLVVGAGPSGMECAMVLGKRGMHVHLVDAANEIGGSIRWISRLPTLGQWARLINYRRIQLDKLKNVTVITNTHLDTDAVRAYGAEIVIIATGAYWARDGFTGLTHEPVAGAHADLPQVLTPEQLMLEDKRPPGTKVTVYDCEGYFMGAGMAEQLRASGYEVDLVTPHPVVASFCDETLEGPMLRQRIHDSGIAMHVGKYVTAFTPGRISGQTEYGADFEMESDSIVLVTQRLSDQRLYSELHADSAKLVAEGIEAIYRIGDCVAPRLLADAVFDGHRMGREIDGPDPSVPLPYLRERVLRPHLPMVAS